MRPHRRQPTRLPCPWDSPGKNTGVGRHFLLQCRKVKSKSEVAQSCPTLSDPMDCSLPGSSVHGIFQARVLEWGAIAFSGTLNRWIPKEKQTETLLFLLPSSIGRPLRAIRRFKIVCNDSIVRKPANVYFLDFWEQVPLNFNVLQSTIMLCSMEHGFLVHLILILYYLPCKFLRGWMKSVNPHYTYHSVWHLVSAQLLLVIICSNCWLEEGMATHSSILVFSISMDRGASQATVHGVAKSWTRLSD